MKDFTFKKKREWLKEIPSPQEVNVMMYNLSDEEWIEFSRIYKKLYYTSRNYESRENRIKKLLAYNWSLTIVPVVLLLNILFFHQTLLFIVYLIATWHYNIFQYRFINLDDADIATFYILNVKDAYKYVKHRVFVSDLELKALLQKEETNIVYETTRIKDLYISSSLEEYPNLAELAREEKNESKEEDKVTIEEDY